MAQKSFVGSVNELDIQLLEPEFFETCLKRGINQVHFVRQEIEKAQGDLLSRRGSRIKMNYTSYHFNMNGVGKNLIFHTKDLHVDLTKAYLTKLYTNDLAGILISAPAGTPAR
jgi:hypothetical protein